MINTNRLTGSHVRYLLALKRLYRPDGIRSMDVAEELSVTKTSVHEMMDAFIRMNYIKKEHGGQIYMTPFGLQQAGEIEERAISKSKPCYSQIIQSTHRRIRQFMH